MRYARLMAGIKQLNAINEANILQITADDAARVLDKSAQTITVTLLNGQQAQVPAMMLDIIGHEARKDAEIGLPTPQSGVWGDIRETRATVNTTILFADAEGLRVRTAPDTGYGVVLAELKRGTPVRTVESAESARARLGRMGEWVRISLDDGTAGYCAAWLLSETQYQPPVGNVRGVNLDALHPLGWPDVSRLASMGFARFVYNVSAGTGSLDLSVATNRYSQRITQMLDAGIQPIIVLNHQTWGEGRGYHWPSMTVPMWSTFTAQYVAFTRAIVEQYKGRGPVYQIWNEQDFPPEIARAQVPMKAEAYANLLGRMVQMIKQTDPSATVITGGHTTGPALGGMYARDTMLVLRNMGLPAPDGFAVHPYGRGLKRNAPDDPFSRFGHIDDELNAYEPILNKPVWITEWGVLGAEGKISSALVGEYAASMLDYLQGKAVCAAWYAWAMGMDDGYGLVNRQGVGIEPLFSVFTS